MTEATDIPRTGTPASTPDFRALLQNPVVPLPLPRDFNEAEEVEQLTILWDRAPRLKLYTFTEFIHAGSSGMVFRVVEINTNSEWAIKIARKKEFQPPQPRKVLFLIPR